MKKWCWLLFFVLIITLYAVKIYANSADLLISEVQITGGTGQTTDDYIKIYNNSTGTIDLYGHRLVKRTANSNTDELIVKWTDPTPLNLRGFYLWAHSDTDNNFGATINADATSADIISDDNGIAICKGTSCNKTTIIDSVAWGDVPIDFVFIETKAIFPYIHKSTVKQIFSRKNNLDTNNNKNDFEIIDINNQNTDPPPVINPAPSSGGGSIYCQATKGDVLINEFLSSPGEDEEEWVELISNCSQTINLEGWILEDGVGTKTTLSGTFDKYFVIDAPKGKLNNAGDLIILKNNNGQIIDEVVYGVWQEQTGPKAPGTSQSLARDADTHEFILCAKPTKGAANVIETQEELEKTTAAKTTATNSPLIISEILPNPLGADSEGEFIELFNQSAQAIALKDWQITNEAGQVFIFSAQTIDASSSLAFDKNTTNLSLKNDHDTIKLYAPNSKTAGQSVSYKNAPEGQSYIYDANEKLWRWSLVATPHKANFLIRPNTEPTAIFYAPESANINEPIFLDGSDSFDPFSTPLNFFWDFGDKSTSTSNAVEHVWSKNGTYIIKLIVNDGELSDTKESKIKIIDPKALPELAIAPNPIAKQVASNTTGNSLLKINAIVVTPPGLFGTQWFYAMPLDDAGKATNAVVQIYNNKKEFPALKIGDLIEAQGELYAIQDDTRLKTKAATDITVLEHDNILVEKTVSLSDLNKNLANELITVSGRMAKQQGSNIILSDNGRELLVELKTNTKLRAKDFTPGSSYQITGLLKQAGDQLKLWPRYSDDIILLDNKQVLGEKIESTSSVPTATINFINNKNKEKTLEYLLITALGLIIGLSVLLFKLKKAPTE